VAAKMALVTAGAIGGTPGSPMPPVARWLEMMWTSIWRGLRSCEGLRSRGNYSGRHGVGDGDFALEGLGQTEVNGALHLGFDAEGLMTVPPIYRARRRGRR